MAALDQIPGPGEPSPKKVIVGIDKFIPSDLGLLNGSVAEIVALIERVAGWDDVENMDLALYVVTADRFFLADPPNQFK